MDIRRVRVLTHVIIHFSMLSAQYPAFAVHFIYTPGVTTCVALTVFTDILFIFAPEIAVA